MTVKMLWRLENRIEKMQAFNTVNTITKNTDEIKNKQIEMNNTITEIKNTLEGTDCRKTEAEEQKAKHWRIDAFELWCWRRLMRVPWTAGDQTSLSWRKSILNIHWKDWFWSWKFQYFGHLIWRVDSEKTLMLAKIEGSRRRGQQRMRCWMASLTQSTWV